MIRIVLSGAALVVVIFLTGCSSVGPAQHFGAIPVESLKSAYVVVAPSGNPNIAEDIVIALGQHGVKVSTGAVQDKPKDVAFFVNYKEHWDWDVTMYLESLDVEFMDNATGQIIASSKFRQGWLHTFPDPRDKTIEVVNSIYAK